ncbi:MAG: hypothetical protein N2595_05215 [bacterium]|nr:hypothetical protein [bacterium]
MKTVLHAFWQRWRNAIIGVSLVMLGSRLGDACNFVYSIFLARWLGDGDFGRASALLLALGIPAATINVLVCRETVWRTERCEPQMLSAFVWRWFWRTLAVATAGALLIIVFNPYVGTILRYEHPAVGVGFAALLVLTLVRPFWQSVVQGQERFAVVAAAPVLEGFLRLMLTMGLLYFFQAGLVGVVAAHVMTGAALLAYGVWFGVRGVQRHSAHFIGKDQPRMDTAVVSTWSTLLSSLAMTAALTLLVSTDMIVVNFVFPGVLADAYAAVATLGKIVLYMPESLAVILLPGLVRDAAYARSSAHTLLWSVAVTLLGGLCLVALFTVWGGEVLRLVYARGFDAYAHLLPWYAAAMGGVAVCRMLGTRAMARSQLIDGVVLLCMAGVQVLGFYMFRRTVEQTTIVLAVTSWLAAVAVLIVEVWRGESGSNQGARRVS